MIIACPACKTRYVVPDSAISDTGRTVRCAKCKHSWFQEPELELPPRAERTSEPEANPVSSPPPEPAPAPPPPPPPAPPPEPERPSPTEPVASSDKDTGRPTTGDSEPVSSDGEGEGPSINHWRTDDHPAAVAATAATAFRQGRTSETPADAAIEEPPAVSEPEQEPLPEPPTVRFATDAADEVAYEDSDDGDIEDSADVSQFDYRPPFTKRRNPLKMWTAAAIIFAVLALGTVAAANFNLIRLPDWAPFSQPTFGIGQSDLELDFPTAEQRKETLPSGTEIFRARGTITNTGRSSVNVPPLLIVLRDERERIVFDWPVAPPKSQLAPGETVTVTEAITDVPRSAHWAEIGWAPN